MTIPKNGKLVIFLHGVGSSGANMAPLGDLWQAGLPDACFAAPDGPYPFESGPGWQWFSIAGITEANRPERVQAVRAEFDRTISAIVDNHGFTQRLAQVAFVGFSQGSIMALDAIASGRWPVGAAVAFSGRLASPAPLTPSTETKVLLIHGDADPVMPVAETERTAATFQSLGIAAETVILPGLGHTISAAGAQQACAFLAWALMAPAGA